MRPAEVAKPLGAFLLVIVVVLAGTALAAMAAGTPSPPPAEGHNVSGQSPGQFQPASVNARADPETGNLSVGTPEGEKRILIDDSHSNRFTPSEIEPLVEVLTEAGHDVDVGADVASGSFGDGYNVTLQRYDAVLVIAPQSGFSTGQRVALQNYTDGGGRLVVLGEPTQAAVTGGSFGLTLGQIGFGANGLTGDYGVRIGANVLYNMNDAANDNNFKSIYAEPTGDDPLTEGVDTLTLETSGYAVSNGDGELNVLFTAADGTRTLETGRTGDYPVVVRNGSMVFVADSSIVSQREMYDADNEVFISNLLTFMVSGDKPEDVPEAPGESDDDDF